jgi:hypothetical protein
MDRGAHVSFRFTLQSETPPPRGKAAARVRLKFTPPNGHQRSQSLSIFLRFTERHNGNNFITPIEDQGGCGSCVAFGTTATVEGTFQVSRNNPNTGIDLSEAQLFYCGAAADGMNCETGWWPDNALNYYQNTGVADAACFPYTAGDQSCNLCSDWQNRVTMITAWHANMRAVDGFVATGWENGRVVQGLWAIDQDLNAWAYFDGGIGWCKISPDNSNILFDMLAQLAAAKAAGRPVNLYRENGVIKQIYIL